MTQIVQPVRDREENNRIHYVTFIAEMAIWYPELSVLILDFLGWQVVRYHLLRLVIFRSFGLCRLIE